jgi:NADPH:quinone reductase-like Zn-dependent oxidoreductase
MSARANPVPPRSVRQQTMKAARVHRYGPPDVIAIEGIDLPTPGEGEILVRVHAAGVGPWDALVRAGNGGLPQTLPLTLGSEVSGVVERVGPGTAGFAVGDDVFGATNPMFVGGYAECALAVASMIVQKPAGLSHEEAASMPVVAVTAWQMLFDRARGREGQTVVVHGGAGNVGAYAVQFAHVSKLRVIATVHGDDADYVRTLGADEVIDTSSHEFSARRFGDFAKRADAVIDTVGGKTQDALFTLAKPGGIIVSSVVRPDARQAAHCGVRADYFIVDVNAVQLARIADMVERNLVRTAVGSTLPLVDARVAHEMLAGARPHRRGKIVLQVCGRESDSMNPVVAD